MKTYSTVKTQYDKLVRISKELETTARLLTDVPESEWGDAFPDLVKARVLLIRHELSWIEYAAEKAIVPETEYDI